MTTEVIIKNKSGLVLAADSAVTVTGIGMDGKQAKVYNSANKLFTLSKIAPVGVLLYNSSSINDIPAEIIIKEFREKGDTFNNLKQYHDALIKFIENFLKENASCNGIFEFFEAFCNIFISIVSKEKEELKENFTYSAFIEKQIEQIKSLCYYLGCPTEISGINALYIKEKLTTDKKIIKKYSEFQEQSGYTGTIDTISDLFYEFFRLRICQSYTGIAVCGYGKKEFFPKVYRIHIYGLIENHLLTGDLISHEGKDAEIIPLAQKQMIDTFIKGVSDKLYENLEGLYFQNFNSFIEAITPSLKEGVDSEEIRTRLSKAFADNAELFKKIVFETEEAPLIQTVSHLSREEMAELAESLINIQVLKYKVSPELETVGGPIDVAIISKHDGFVWRKRKLYFPKELNFQFFENYFK